MLELEGSFQGALSSLTAPELGATSIRAAVDRAGLKLEDVQEVIMGCVLPAGLGQAPARQASLGAGIPQSTGCTTVNKMCGSAMKAVMLAHDLITAGSNVIVVAGTWPRWETESGPTVGFIFVTASSGMSLPSLLRR